MHLVWNIGALLCLLTAAAFWWQSNTDWAFVFAALGVVAWFLDQRNQLQRTCIEKDNSDFVPDTDRELDEKQNTN